MDLGPLKEAGLTDGEVKVYLALVEGGPSSIGPILERSQITKSIIYRILDKLVKKGLVSFVIKDKTKIFQAAAPKNLLEVVDKKKQELEATKEAIEVLIPQIISLQTLQTKSTATIYEGFKGLMTAYENRYEKLNAGDEVVLYGLPAKQPEHHHAKWQRHNILLEQKNIRSRLLYNFDVDDIVLHARNRSKGCRAKRMLKSIATPSWVMVYKDTVLIAIPQGEHPLAIEIVNSEIAKSFFSYFESLWALS